jgi:hypothetical protein
VEGENEGGESDAEQEKMEEVISTTSGDDTNTENDTEY